MNFFKVSHFTLTSFKPIIKVRGFLRKTLFMKTFLAKKDDLARKWFVIDLSGVVLGRAATQIASVLRGKHRPDFTPSVDTGDFVVAINASKIQLTGKKLEVKTYYRHTGYPGGIREEHASDLINEKPDFILRKAVEGMLPKNILGRQQLKKLKIFAGAEHPHSAQKPQELKF